MSIGVIDMEGLRLGIDLGGTTVKVGLVDEELEIVDKVIYRSRPLDEMAACAEFSDQLKAFVVEARYDPAEIEGIGVAIPGTVLGAEVELLPNIQLDLQLLLESLRDYFPNADLAYLNDANAGALAEAAFGAGVGYRNVLYVTIGTGIGAGVVIGGKVIAGAHGAAGEIGHVSVAKGGRRCSWSSMRRRVASSARSGRSGPTPRLSTSRSTTSKTISRTCSCPSTMRTA